MQKEENYAITNLSDPESSLSQLLMFLLQESAVMKLLLVFLNLSKLDLYNFGQIPGNSLTMFPCGDEFKIYSCPDGKQALST